MKRFWLKTLLLVPVPLMVVGFNWFVDPVHLRNADQYEYDIAQLVLDGKRVTNISNPNEAAYIKFFVDGLKTRKDVLVLGSSRSKLIRSDSFPTLSFFNNSIAGAGLVDYLAIYQMYRQKRLIPSIAVVELSPWILMRDYSSVWKTLNAHKQQLERWVLSPTRGKSRPMDIRSSIRADFSEFLSLGYFQTSFYTWADRLRHPTEHKDSCFVWQEGTLPMGETLLTDGSAIYPEYVEHTRDREHVTALAIEYARKPAGIPQSIDPECQKVLEAFLDQLAHDGVRAVLYLPPYHPKAYALMVDSPQDRIIVGEQKYYEELARRKGLTLVGSYNPADFGLDETAFFDGSHATQEAVRKLFAARLPAEEQARAVNRESPDHVELAGVNNPNGLELVDGKPFFWIGDGDTCLSIRSTRAGTALITFHAEAGPSAPGSPQRTLLLKAAHKYSRLVLIEQYPQVAISFPVDAGLSEVCLTPQDKPTVLEQPNGDRRPLLLGVSDLQVKLLPEGAIPPDRAALAFQFASGWHPVERSGRDWLCWTDGRGRLIVQTDRETTGSLSGEILSARRPNNVDVIVNGEKIKTLAVDWPEWAFRSFGPLRLPLKSGQNSIEFVSEKPPLVQPSDPRPLAVAIKNLRLVEVDAR
ncbi:MAG TPA: hypothetical protein VL486_13500 [Verrucomicrobiae bacterium]|nr:hypothetical protein [Verrucomicrobiae bacterium]